jgi:hypothetical protein
MKGESFGGWTVYYFTLWLLDAELYLGCLGFFSSESTRTTVATRKKGVTHRDASIVFECQAFKHQSPLP